MECPEAVEGWSTVVERVQRQALCEGFIRLVMWARLRSQVICSSMSVDVALKVSSRDDYHQCSAGFM